MAVLVYATPQEYADWLTPEAEPGTAEPPAGAARALRAASRWIRRLTMTALYAVDGDGYPADTGTRAVFRDATCAQAAYAKGIGDPYGTGAAAVWSSLKLGSASMSRGQSAGGGTDEPDPVGPEVVLILQEAGLIPGDIQVCG
jgi:hypothetical protein